MSPWPQMKEQKAAEAVPKEHEQQETKGVKAEEQPKVPSPHTPVVSTPTNRAMERPNQIS
jgi:DNA-binding transcriptional regulator of glucitol operon